MTLPMLASFDPESGLVRGATPKSRHLDGLRGYFLDGAAYQRALETANPLVYSVTAVEPAQGEGQLHYGIGRLMPGRVGREYYFTAGHLHAYRPAAEVYIGLGGEGLMLLEDEATGETTVRPLGSNQIVYVPGYTAHRTVNCGQTPVIYLGIYPAQAGHDYRPIEQRNFAKVVLDIGGKPVVLDRQEALAQLED